MRRLSFRMSREERKREIGICRSLGHTFWPVLAGGVVTSQQCQFCGEFSPVENGAALVDEMAVEALAYRERRDIQEPDEPEQQTWEQRLTLPNGREGTT